MSFVLYFFVAVPLDDAQCLAVGDDEGVSVQ